MKFEIKHNLSLVIGSILFILLLFGIGDTFNQKNRSLVQWYLNKEANDNSKNWSCHNYAYNLMNTAEPNTIFMTEGGDNQVFSLLYFSYVERRRPDIDFYDQKGNVFPRLYGDLMNTSPDDITLIRQLRDFQFLSTSRPVYLTWKRPEIEKLQINKIREQHQQLLKKTSLLGYQFKKYELNTLEQFQNTIDRLVPKATFNMKFKDNTPINKVDMRHLGPWFLKRYGLLYKALPLRYAIVEGLTHNGWQASYERLLSYVADQTKIQLDKNDFNKYAQQLADEGLIEIQNNYLVLKKNLDWPFIVITSSDDYWNSYIFHYTNTPNAKAWDYLTREILINYNLQLANHHKTQVASLQRAYDASKSSEQKDNLHAKIKKRRDLISMYYDKGCDYSHDNPVAFLTKANYWFQQGNIALSLETFSNSTKKNYGLFYPYINIAQIILNNYISKASSADKEKEYIYQVKSNLTEAMRRLKLAQKVKTGKIGNLSGNQDYQTMQYLMHKVEGYLTIPTIKLQEQFLKANRSGSLEEYKTLANYYAKRYEFQQAAAIYDRLITQEPSQIAHWIEKYKLVRTFNIEIAIGVLEEMISKYDFFTPPKPAKYDLLEALCQHFTQKGHTAFNNRSWQVASIAYNRSLLHGNNFMKIVQPLAKDNVNIKDRAIQMAKNIQSIQERIKLLERILSSL